MIKSATSSLKKVVPTAFRNWWRLKKPHAFRNYSYSLEGEDLILLRLLDGKRNGFYVDVGAYHPCRFSNTYLLSKRGWRGCNIEPNSNLFSKFQTERPDDLNLNLGVSDVVSELDYYVFEEGAINTFDLATANHKEKILGYKLLETKKVKVQRLETILRNIESKTGEKLQIDLLNIDVENHEWNVLQSNDWTAFRPGVICIEIHSKNIEELQSDRSYQFLRSMGYRLVAKTPMTCIFARLKE